MTHSAAFSLTYRHENTAIQKVELVSTNDSASFTPNAFYRKVSDITGVTQYKMSVQSTGTVASVTRTEYDAMNRVKYSVNALGGVTAFAYDLAGRRTIITNYLSYVLSNIATDTIAPPTNATSIVTKSGFDPNGNQTWTIDGNGRQTDFIYDSMNRRTRTDFPQVTGETGRKSQATVYDGFGSHRSHRNQSSTFHIRASNSPPTETLGGRISPKFGRISPKSLLKSRLFHHWKRCKYLHLSFLLVFLPKSSLDPSPPPS